MYFLYLYFFVNCVCKYNPANGCHINKPSIKYLYCIGPYLVYILTEGLDILDIALLT